MYRMCRDRDESSLSPSVSSGEEERWTDDYDSSKDQTGEDASEEDEGPTKDQVGEDGSDRDASDEDTGSDEDTRSDAGSGVNSMMTSGYGTLIPGEERDSCRDDTRMKDSKEDPGSRDSFYDDDSLELEDDQDSFCGSNVPHEERKEPENEQSHWNLNADTRSEDQKRLGAKTQENICDLLPDTSGEDDKKPELDDDLHPETSIEDTLPEDKKQPENTQQTDTENEDDKKEKRNYCPPSDERKREEDKQPLCDLHLNARGEDVLHEDKKNQQFQYDRHSGAINDHVPHEDQKMKPYLDLHSKDGDDPNEVKKKPDESYHDTRIEADEAMGGLLGSEEEERIRDRDKNPSSQNVQFLDSEGSLLNYCSSSLSGRLSELRLHEAENDKASVAAGHMEEDSLSTFGSFTTSSTRSRSESDFRTKPKSFIRPILTQQTIKKEDPVARYFQYKQLWDELKLPGEQDHRKLRWEIRERLAYRQPPPKARRCLAANSYVVPTEKKRSALRWEIRNLMAHPLPQKFTCRF
ncbi:protein starmaker isoform X2 [Syngnathus scovelli]|uniref:protein starmaker isoform X2 n=1 Tax=Syngnathus scovelli TaxID=161590 RepID=UPI0021106ADF|nr:dentin matrix acidic phosphoprotein 1 isoform X2 [Syngnathus scovelli]